VLGLFDVASAVSYRSLMILSFAQLINVFMGSVGVILSMSGNQRYSIYTLAVSIVLNIVLDII
jgi:Na+-driven multidrug efflux pump